MKNRLDIGKAKDELSTITSKVLPDSRRKRVVKEIGTGASQTDAHAGSLFAQAIRHWLSHNEEDEVT